jgi:RNA polymerase sigma-70 factor (ECF subfamily)
VTENSAGEEFWQKVVPFKAKVFNYIRKSLNFSADSEDVYQETILRAYQYIGTYKDGRDFGAWLFKIAQNEIRKYCRKSPRAALSFDKVNIGCCDHSPNHLLVEHVYRFAQQLKPEHREVFFLFYDQGFTIKEISQITGFREGNIKFILNRARQSLRTIIGAGHEQGR